jgi:stage II sporulation protein D
MKISFLFLLLLIYNSTCFAYIIKVDLFNQFLIKTLVISPIEGKYEFTTEKGTVHKLKRNQITYFTVVGDSISAWDSEQYLGLFKTISFDGSARQNAFKIEPSFPALSSRYYEGNLTLTTVDQQFRITNWVDIDSYLAGVVEAESGPNAPYEFYKSQAVISRTYLMEQISRQGTVDYKIGDDVNHQVYKGMSLKNPLIKQAVAHTTGLIIVDSVNNLITAAFHSNSGGQTLNSEDVWLKPTSYLKTIADPFSLEQRNTEWKDSILVDEWFSYLETNGIHLVDDVARIDNLFFEQPLRKKNYVYGNDTIPLKKIRQDFRLRSTWFSFKPDGNQIIISGKGYGHGVGLSQEGAMQMARQNYSFLDIIYYYYKNVKVIDYRQVVK